MTANRSALFATDSVLVPLGADAIGNHALAVREAYADFRTLATVILERMPPLPTGLLDNLVASGAPGARG